MRASVLAIFPAFTDGLEGFTTWPYLDVKGLATVGRGDLVSVWPVFRALPWQIDSVPASAGDVASAWGALGASPPARVAAFYAGVTALRLTKDAVDSLSMGKLAEMWAVMSHRFSNLEELPADAQLALCSLAWADGPMFNYPKLEAALSIEDFARFDASGSLVPGCCAAECGISTVGNPGVKPRNVRNLALFVAAQRVVDSGGDPDVITGWEAS